MVCVVYGLYIVCLSYVIAAEHGRYGSMEYCGANKAEYLVHLVRMNRHLNRCNSFSHYCAIVLEKRRRKEERSQKIDDLPILVTCWSGTLAVLSSEVNDPVAHGSAR